MKKIHRTDTTLWKLIDCEQSLFGQSRLSSAGVERANSREQGKRDCEASESRGKLGRRWERREGLHSLLNQTCSGNSAHQRRQPVKNILICHLISVE